MIRPINPAIPNPINNTISAISLVLSPMTYSSITDISQPLNMNPAIAFIATKGLYNGEHG